AERVGQLELQAPAQSLLQRSLQRVVIRGSSRVLRENTGEYRDRIGRAATPRQWIAARGEIPTEPSESDPGRGRSAHSGSPGNHRGAVDPIGKVQPSGRSHNVHEGSG